MSSVCARDAKSVPLSCIVQAVDEEQRQRERHPRRVSGRQRQRCQVPHREGWQ
jgi:hypothetical protein